VPTPEIVTVTESGAQPSLSAYRTENVTGVDVVPEPGVAVPFVSVTVWEAPLQLAARTGGAEVSSPARIAISGRRRAFMVRPTRPARTVSPGSVRAGWPESPTRQ